MCCIVLHRTVRLHPSATPATAARGVQDFTKVEWIANVASAIVRDLAAASPRTTQLRLRLAAVRDASYGGSAMAHDEFDEADAADFSVELPAQMPADEGGGGEAPAAGRWVRQAAAERPVGRLVVPREERLQLQRGTNPLVQFFYSLLPWAMAPPRRPD